MKNSETGASKNITWYLIVIAALGLTAFHLYTAGISMFGAWLQRDIHLVFILVLAFLIFPLRKSGRQDHLTVIDAVFILAAIASGLYILIFYQDIVMRAGAYTNTDIFFGIILIIALLEAARRATGWVMVLIAGVFLLYAFLGP
ncbi:MAG: C4-dicarboxylate ABC transporter permease, partial [Clostridia bacterium]|nr:C4-dicarboxylate ABC transporter permease [Clostridia bacterium]